MISIITLSLAFTGLGVASVAQSNTEIGSNLVGVMGVAVEAEPATSSLLTTNLTSGVTETGWTTMSTAKVATEIATVTTQYQLSTLLGCTLSLAPSTGKLLEYTVNNYSGSVYKGWSGLGVVGVGPTTFSSSALINYSTLSGCTPNIVPSTYNAKAVTIPVTSFGTSMSTASPSVVGAITSWTTTVVNLIQFWS